MTSTRSPSFARLPLTYDESRARFRRAASTAGLSLQAHPIAAPGPEGQRLSIDVVELGDPDAPVLLVVLSGVHGVEGPIGSALQTDLLERRGAASLPAGVGVLLVHAVNPWGMAWGRRQNESNVDLNRNWRRDDVEPVHNEPYDQVHHLACPAGEVLPDVGELLATAEAVVADRGLAWVRDAITAGQYRHPDGLHYGGARTEESCRIVEAVARERIVGRDRVLVLDLHTGHGPRAEVTLLSDQPPGSPQDRFFRASFPGVRVEATVGNPEATTGLKSGQVLNTLAFPSLGHIQSEVVGITADLLHGEGAAGFLTSGGTESILMAVKAARERARQERGVTEPEMVVPVSAHAAFHKAAHYFGITVHTVPVGDDWRVDVAAVADAIGDDTVLVVGSAPQYPQGVIDPIPELAALAAEAGANFHTDACMGGFVLPFMEELGHDVAPWDFRVDGVTSISADLHKLGYAPKGASVILHRTKDLRRHQTFVFEDWLGGFYASPNMQGTRAALPMACAWAILHHLGLDGYLRLIERTIATRERLVAGVRALPELRVLGEPEAHLVAITAADVPDPVDVFALGDSLQRRGWFHDRQKPPDSLHATVSAGNAPVIEDYLGDLAAAVAEVAGARLDDRSTNYATLE